MTGEFNSTFTQIGSEMSQVASTGDLRVIPIFGRGSLQNLGDLLNLRGVDLALTTADALPFAERNGLYPGLRSKLSYVTGLYSENINIVANTSIKSLPDLEGKNVNIDVAGSDTNTTASQIFNILNIPVKMTNYPASVGLEELKKGKIDAVVHVVANPARLLADIPADSGLHVLPIAPSGALAQTYGTTTLTHADYPALIAEDDTIQTLTVPVLLTAFDWPPNSTRYRTLAKFTELLFSHISDLMQPPFNENWKNVDLLAPVPGWTRTAYAQQWLGTTDGGGQDLKQQFAKWTSSIGLSNLSPAQSASLFDLWKSREAQARH